MDERTSLATGFPRIQSFPISTSTFIACIIAACILVHQVLVHLDYPVLSIQEFLWNGLVFILPARLLLDHAKRLELRANRMLPQTHAAKSEALRQILGMSTGVFISHMPTGISSGELGESRSPREVARRMSQSAANWVGMSRLKGSDKSLPAGLGNWDNSCYQNSVLQGLSSLTYLRKYLKHEQVWDGEDTGTTKASLLEMVTKLTGGFDNGKTLWTPAKLKSMSSWQQQDAQEYYSKIMDELDKEHAKCAKSKHAQPGFSDAAKVDISGDDLEPQTVIKIAGRRNPLEGLLAQRVACTKCAYSEGLTMIPFNCLTLPLSSGHKHELSQCLDEYTKLEEIPDVECPKCTLLRSQEALQKMLGAPPTPAATPEPTSPTDWPETQPPAADKTLALPAEIREMVTKRLRAIQEALLNDDFGDETLKEKCQIPKKARVSSTKTRQAVIGRPPRSLVIHINRSVFDEHTGAQRKNYAPVHYPLLLYMGQWVLGGGVGDKEEAWGMEPSRSILASTFQSVGGLTYVLQAVIQHYGRHENGHYIAYRRHANPTGTGLESGDVHSLDEDSGPGEQDSRKWYRFSDEDVSEVSEENALSQGGVFMLFYERVDQPCMPTSASVNELCGPEGEPTDIRQTTETVGYDRTTDDAAYVPDADDMTASSTITESESELETDEHEHSLAQSSKPPSPQVRLRTAMERTLVSESPLEQTLRPMAAT